MKHNKRVWWPFEAATDSGLWERATPWSGPVPDRFAVLAKDRAGFWRGVMIYTENRHTVAIKRRITTTGE